MGFFDSIKDMADKAKNTVQQQLDEKAERDRIKHEKEQAAKAKADEQAKIDSDKIIGGKTDNTSFFSSLALDKLTTFTKDYYQKLVMPACSVNHALMLMYPYTDDNVSKRNLSKRFGTYKNTETVIFTWNIKSSKEYIALTNENLYIKHNLSKCEIPMQYDIIIRQSDISQIGFEADETNIKFIVNNTDVITVPLSQYKSDYINLDYYFDCIKNKDYEITDEEIDKLIHEKVGDAVYSDAIKNIDADDKIIYFAWGLDSVTAKDYLMCTKRQFVMIDRELMGAAKNVKRFYYEDITSMSIEQENKDSLTVTLLNAALKLCNLIVFVAGTKLEIKTLSVPEAQRVIEIYTKYKSDIRQASMQPQKVVIENSENKESPLDQIKKLNELKELGIISEDEFNTKKSDILSKM